MESKKTETTTMTIQVGKPEFDKNLVNSVRLRVLEGRLSSSQEIQEAARNWGTTPGTIRTIQRLIAHEEIPENIVAAYKENSLNTSWSEGITRYVTEKDVLRAYPGRTERGARTAAYRLSAFVQAGGSLSDAAELLGIPGKFLKNLYRSYAAIPEEYHHLLIKSLSFDPRTADVKHQPKPTTVCRCADLEKKLQEALEMIQLLYEVKMDKPWAKTGKVQVLRNKIADTTPN